MQLYDRYTSFTVKLKPIDYIAFECDEWPRCKFEVYINDGCSTFEFNRLSLCKFHIEKIIEYIDKTLNNEFTKKTRLKFEDPLVLGGPVYSPISFEIYGFENHDCDYWKFIYSGAGGWNKSGKNSFSMCLSREDLAGLRQMITDEMQKINWDDCGKTDYYKIEFPEIPYKQCYSASKLKDEMLSLCRNKRIENVMIETLSLTELYNNTENYCYFDIGSTVLLYFNDFIIDFQIDASGLFKYRVIPKKDIVSIEKVFDKLPSYDSPCFSEVESLFSKKFIGEAVVNCSASSTEHAPFGNLDKSLMGDPAELPADLIFELSNQNKLFLSGNEIEYFAITVE